jgi:cysteine desulfurase/selenocysteine lyase
MGLEKYRRQFPALQQKIGGRPIVYFDNAAMTLKPDIVLDAIRGYYEEYTSVTGRSAHKWAAKTTEKVDWARKEMSRFIGCRQEEVVFTKNTTESINLVANSLGLKKGDVVITSDREHNSNLVPWLFLRDKKGIKHNIVKSKKDETFDLEAFKEILNKQVKLVSLVHTSNLDGYTLPAKEIIKLAHDNGSLVMLDGAQGVPHKDVDFKKLDVDFLAFSVHKLCGPTGMGVLVGKKDLMEEMDGFIVGGDTVQNTTYTDYKFLEPPEKFEAGLQNYAGIIGSGAAAKFISRIGRDRIAKQELKLSTYIIDELSKLDKINFVGVKDANLKSGIASFNIKDMDPHDVALVLDEMNNIFIRSGYHCVHSWFNDRGIKGSARASLYFYNTMEEAELFIESVKKITAYLG